MYIKTYIDHSFHLDDKELACLEDVLREWLRDKDAVDSATQYSVKKNIIIDIIDTIAFRDDMLPGGTDDE